MHVSIVTPVYNDWESFAVLLQHLDAVAKESGDQLTVHAIDDGSIAPAVGLDDVVAQLSALAGVEVVSLALNLGHQRAIAVGLCLAAEEGADLTVVMDSDGEDTPEQIPLLLQQARLSTSSIVVARRARRQESLTFRIAYTFYRLLFRAFAGRPIRFGNFSVLPRACVSRLVLMPDLWNNLASAFLRSRLPLVQVSVDRGKRYAGRSTMNLTGLVIHGFSAISAYAETIFVRLLATSAALFALTLVAVLVTVGLRLFAPRFATPGWATTVSFGMIIVLLQVVFVTLTSMLSLMNGRMQMQVIPQRDYRIFVGKRTTYATGACRATELI